MEEKMDIKDAIKEIRQSRSRYQIEKFVVGQHQSPEMQYYQLCVEMNGLINTIKETKLRIQKVQAEAEELRETGKKSDAIEAEIKEMSIEELENHILGSERELAFMQELFDQYPKYTREEIEEAQPAYWEQRLTRVAQLQMLSAQGGVDWAQLEAIYQANIMEKALEQIPTMNFVEDRPEVLIIENKEKKND
jgi:hypothetical protein